MTIKALYPTVRPTLNLDFAKTKALDPRVTYTRATSGTYVGADGLIKTAAANVPRFDHNPATGESLGLLVEEDRTNSEPNSNSFNWAPTNPKISSSATVDPLLGTNAKRLTPTTANEVHGWQRYMQYGTGNYAFSMFVRPAGYSRISIGCNNFGANDFTVDLSGIGSYTAGNATTFPTGLVKLADGWFRLTWQWINGGGGGANDTFPYCIVLNNSGQSTFVGDGTSGVDFYGFQVEIGSAFSTSYIPTSGSTVTRAADVASITGTNFSSWYNQSAGSFFVNANHKGSSHFNNAIFLKVNNGTTSNQIKIFSVGADPYLYITYIAAEQAYIDAGSVSVGLPNKYAAGFTVNNFALSVNGATAVTDTSGTSPMDMTQLTIGARLSGVGQPNGTIARLAYYPVRLPNAQLQALTAT